jgi:hypothetical protein
MLKTGWEPVKVGGALWPMYWIWNVTGIPPPPIGVAAKFTVKVVGLEGTV